MKMNLMEKLAKVGFWRFVHNRLIHRPLRLDSSCLTCEKIIDAGEFFLVYS